MTLQIFREKDKIVIINVNFRNLAELNCLK
mgnify:CR=1 FL=1